MSGPYSINPPPALARAETIQDIINRSVGSEPTFDSVCENLVGVAAYLGQVRGGESMSVVVKAQIMNLRAMEARALRGGR